MAKNRKYTEAEVVRSLNKKADCKVSSSSCTVEVNKDNTTLGNGSWGKIDYLRKVHHYVVVFVNRITGRPKPVVEEQDAPRNRNMADITRDIMRKARSY